MDTKSDIYRLTWALANIMDWMRPHEIAEETGLPEEDCELINKIRNVALIFVQAMNWKTPE